MITAQHGPLISRPTHWIVVFDRRAGRNWISRLTLGKYKHVRAYGYVPFLHVWLFFDPNFSGIELLVAANGDAANMLASAWTNDCDVIVMPRSPHENRSATLALAGWCVPQIKRLLGLRCVAVTPDALFRRCLQHGGQLYARQPSHADHAGAAANGTGAGHAAADASPSAVTSGDTTPLHATANR